MNCGGVVDALQLASSLDPQLACVGARGWGRLEEVFDLCVGGGGEWAVHVMREVVMGCSDAQLAQNCQKWRVKIVAALQHCSGTLALRLLCQAVAALVSRAHHSPSAVRDFSTTSLPPLLSPLMRFQESAPSLQSAVLPCLSTIYHLYPGTCKPHRSALLSWGKEGLLNSDLSLSRECARLLVVTHSSCDQWCSLLNSSLSSLCSSLFHLSHTLTQTTHPPDKLNLDLPPSEPERSVHLLHLISSHCRLLSYLLLSPPPSLTLPLSTLVGVVSFGLHIGGEQIVTMATDSLLLLLVLPAIKSSLLSLLHSLITSAHHHLLPYSTTIDTILLDQLGKGGVVWQECVHGAVCAWVRVRGEGGKGDKFSTAITHLLLQLCQNKGQGVVVRSLKTLCVLMDCCRAATIQPRTARMVWQAAQTVLVTSSSLEMTLAGVRLLQNCLGYPNSTPLSTAIRVFQSHAHHTCEKIRDESRRGLIMCGLLMHPRGPPWYTGELPHVITSEAVANPEAEGGMYFQPTPQTNVNLSTPSGSNFLEAPELHMVNSRKRQHPDDGEDEGETEEVEMSSAETDASHGEAGSHHELEGVGTSSQENTPFEEGRGDTKKGGESGDSDVEDILATFCSSPSSSDCS